MHLVEYKYIVKTNTVGFIRFYCLADTSTSWTTCENTLDEVAQFIQSPNYPESFEAITCSWTLVAPQGKRLRINAFHYEIKERNERGYNCTVQYLRIYDGRNASESRIVKLCGESTQAAFYSSSNAIYIKFQSANDDEQTGFKIFYHFVGKQINAILIGSILINLTTCKKITRNIFVY